MQLAERHIDAIIEWWCKVLANPKYDNLGPVRNTDMTSKEYWDERKERKPSELASIIATVYLSHGLTPEMILAFGAHLREVLEGKCEHTWTSEWQGTRDPKTYLVRNALGVWHGGLHVDYEPDVVLRHCGEIAGFPKQGFEWPWKTNMWFSNAEGVRVGYGYAAPIVSISPPSFPDDMRRRGVAVIVWEGEFCVLGAPVIGGRAFMRAIRSGRLYYPVQGVTT